MSAQSPSRLFGATIRRKGKLLVIDPGRDIPRRRMSIANSALRVRKKLKRERHEIEKHVDEIET